MQLNGKIYISIECCYYPIKWTISIELNLVYFICNKLCLTKGLNTEI